MEKCKVIAVTNQKGGVGKTTTTVNLGVGLAQQGKKVLLVDTDPRGSLTVRLGVKNPDELDTTISDLMQVVVDNGNLSPLDRGILKDIEGIDLVPSNIGLSSFEVSLVNTMSREFVLRSYLGAVKRNYDYVLIDCMPSLGMLTINALAAADSVLIPCQANYLSTKGLKLLMGSVAKVRRQINPELKIDGILLTMVDSRTNNAKSIIAALRQTGSNLRVLNTEIPFSVRAAELAELPTVLCIVRELTDDGAVIIMVDSNLQREQVLPSEKAFAYKMKLDAMKRQAGRPSKENGATVLPHFSGKKSRELLAEQSGESHEQIRKYIRLTNLIPELLDMVDNSVLKEKDKLQMALRPAVELSYLTEDEQRALLETLTIDDCTPSHAQAIKMRDFSEKGKLNADVILSIMQEEKPNQVEQFKMPKDRISKFFSPGTPAQKIEDTIVKALEMYRRRQREMER